MKFGNHKYWRHQNAMDVFFCISSVAFDDDGKNAILNGWWCTQGLDGWWHTVFTTLKIKPDQYDAWYSYTPYGIQK